jgi:multidrug resistance efflux pump
VDDNSKKAPSANLGTAWAVYMPTAADANVGTSPDANMVIAMKEKDVVDWTKNIEVLNKEVKRLEGLKSPTATDKSNIARYKAAVTTFNIGIKNANTNIKNLRANISLLNSSNSNKAIVESLKSDVDQAKMIRTQSCARGI